MGVVCQSLACTRKSRLLRCIAREHLFDINRNALDILNIDECFSQGNSADI